VTDAVLTPGLSGLSPVMMLVLAAIGLIVGMLIGSIGIGGVLLVPGLVYLAGVDIHIAIASCMLSYAFSGLMGAWVYTRRGTIRWTTGGWLSLGAMPGAALGAPLLLVPLLVWCGWPVLGAVGLSQLIQIPIALLASVANYYYGAIDLLLGLAVAVVITTGVTIGANVAHVLPVHLLRKLVISALIMVAGWMLIRVALGLL